MPANFAGLTLSGVPLAELVDLLLRALRDVRAGVSTQDSMNRGMRRAVLYASNEITEAGCATTQTQLISDRRVAGHERVVKLPACDRCIMLAGRLYRFSTYFRRHPRCDCTMRPVTRQQWRESNLDNHPRALFDQMTRDQQDEKFGAGNAAAIRAGADISQVVNARRGTQPVAGQWTTTAGTTNRGLAGMRMGQLAKTPGGRYRRSQLTRPTAGQVITDLAGASRDELISALRRYGYVL